MTNRLINESLQNSIAIVSDWPLHLQVGGFALIAWKATEKAVFYWETNMQVDILFIPLAPFQLFLAIGAVLLCLELIAQMIELIPQMKGGS